MPTSEGGETGTGEAVAQHVAEGEPRHVPSICTAPPKRLQQRQQGREGEGEAAEVRRLFSRLQLSCFPVAACEDWRVIPQSAASESHGSARRRHGASNERSGRMAARRKAGA